MDDAGLVDPELHLACLDVLDRLGHVHGDGAGLGIRHQAAGTEDPAQATDHPHHVGGRHDRVELEPAALDLGRQVLAADHVGAGLLGLLDLLAAGEDRHSGGSAGAVRQDDRAADHLVGVLGVDPQAHGDLHRFIELGERELLDPSQGLLELEGLGPFRLLDRVAVLLAVSWHGRVFRLVLFVSSVLAPLRYNSSAASLSRSLDSLAALARSG
jgi:hypothetical protein